jgi:hypothetical protein
MDLAKIRTPSLALGLILALAATAPANAQKRGQEEHRSPMVLIFAPNEDDKQLLDQYQQNARAQDAFDGADIDIIYVIGDHMVKLPPPDMKTVSAGDLRKRYHVDATGFRVVLVGDDGWEKTRWSEPTSPRVIMSRAPDMPKPKSPADDKK